MVSSRTTRKSDVDNGQMREILPDFRSLLNVPFDLISRFALYADPATGVQRAEIDFQKDVVVPVPFLCFSTTPAPSP